MARIFLSYARADGLEIAQDLANKLRAAEHEVFLDLSSITAGTRWREEITRRIKWSDLLVVLVTAQSNDSDFVFQEITEADNLGKTIVPIQVDDTPLPVHLRGTWQAIPLRNNDLQRVQLELERTIRKLQKLKQHARRRMTITASIAALAVVAIVLFLVFGLGENPDDDSLETEAVEGVAAEGTSGSTPTDTKAPVTIGIEGITIDDDADELVISLRNIADEQFDSYLLQLRSSTTGLVTGEFLHTPPPYEIRIPLADIEAGEYTAILRALATDGRLLSEAQSLSFAYDPPPTPTPKPISIEGITIDDDADELVISLRNIADEQIDSYLLQLRSSDTGLVTGEFLHTPPPYEIRIPLADFKAGEYTAILRALATDGSLVSEAHPLSFAYHPPPSPTVTATVEPSSTPTRRPTNSPVPPTATNTPLPTPTEIPRSAMIYENDFEDRNLSDWDIPFPEEAGFWQVTTEHNGNQALDITAHPDQCAEGFIGQKTWKNYAIELQFKVLSPAVVEIWFRHQNYDNYYAFASYPTFGEDIGLRRTRSGTTTIFYQNGWFVHPIRWNSLHIEVQGNRISASLNGLDFPENFDDSFAVGSVGLVVCSGSSEDSRVLFDNLIIWSLD